MSSRWHRWVAATSATNDATSLALFRIAMGLGALLTVGSVVWAGLVPVIWVDAAHGGLRRLGSGGWLIRLLGGPTPGVVWSVVAGSLGSSLLLALGVGGRVGGRVVAAVCLLTTGALVNLNGHAGGSYDALLTNGLWLCVLAGGSATLSVSAWRETGQWWPAVQVLAFPRWLAVFQLVVMYCMTGVQKVSATWVPGGDASALYYILQQPSWHHRDMSWLAWVFPLTQIGTTVTWFWEVSSPLWALALWWSTRPHSRGPARWANRVGLRWWYFGIGVLMHATIWATMNVGPFSFLSLGFYTVMVHPEEWRRLLRG